MTTRPEFEVFFQTATGHAPYAYQRRLPGDTAGTPCASQLISIPSGLGKTAAVGSTQPTRANRP